MPHLKSRCSRCWMQVGGTGRAIVLVVASVQNFFVRRCVRSIGRNTQLHFLHILLPLDEPSNCFKASSILASCRFFPKNPQLNSEISTALDASRIKVITWNYWLVIRSKMEIIPFCVIAKDKESVCVNFLLVFMVTCRRLVTLVEFLLGKLGHLKSFDVVFSWSESATKRVFKMELSNLSWVTKCEFCSANDNKVLDIKSG